MPTRGGDGNRKKTFTNVYVIQMTLDMITVVIPYRFNLASPITKTAHCHRHHHTLDLDFSIPELKSRGALPQEEKEGIRRFVPMKCYLVTVPLLWGLRFLLRTRHPVDVWKFVPSPGLFLCFSARHDAQTLKEGE